MSELDRLVGFGRRLRRRGLPVGTGRIVSFCRAVGVLDDIALRDLYWAGRATLISSKQHIEEFDRAFASYFGSVPVDEENAADPVEGGGGLLDEEQLELELGSSSWVLPDEEADEEGDMAIGIVASDTEVLREKSFEDLSDVELKQAAALIRKLSVSIPVRHVRRLRPAPKGRHLDVRRTLRYSLRTQGEPFRRARKERTRRMRPLVLILDVSGSMSPYSRALMQFGFAAMAAGRRVEVFCFGTRLTRVTRSLRTKDPDRALKAIAIAVKDWEGGTLIGSSLHELLARYSHHGFMREAVVVLCSDGLERGDPAVLTLEMERLGRLAHKLVWVNPLKGSPAYEPLARGMAAALPHIDLFVTGHNLASLEELGKVLED